MNSLWLRYQKTPKAAFYLFSDELQYFTKCLFVLLLKIVYYICHAGNQIRD